MSKKKKKKRQRIYDLLNVEIKFLCRPYTTQRKKFTKKEVFKVKGKLNKKRKEGFLTALATVIQKDPTMSIRKHANELKVHVKTVRTAVKQDLTPDLNPLDYAIWSVLEKKTDATSHRNIKTTTIEEE